MDNEIFNMSIRSFLKMVGVGSQREIEQAVAQALVSTHLKGHEKLPVRMTLVMKSVNLEVSFDGVIQLDGSTT